MDRWLGLATAMSNQYSDDRYKDQADGEQKPLLFPDPASASGDDASLGVRSTWTVRGWQVWGSPWRGSERRGRRLRGSVHWEGIVPILLCHSKVPAAHPRVQLRPGGIDRAHPVVQMPVYRHPLPFFPTLDRGHVSAEI